MKQNINSWTLKLISLKRSCYYLIICVFFKLPLKIYPQPCNDGAGEILGGAQGDKSPLVALVCFAPYRKQPEIPVHLHSLYPLTPTVSCFFPLATFPSEDVVRSQLFITQEGGPLWTHLNGTLILDLQTSEPWERAFCGWRYKFMWYFVIEARADKTLF